MLNRRTHILFDEDTFNLLSWLSNQRKVSIGELVRKAVKKTYKKELTPNEKRKKAIDKILSQKPIDISPFKAKDLIKMGRRF